MNYNFVGPYNFIIVNEVYRYTFVVITTLHLFEFKESVHINHICNCLLNGGLRCLQL